VQPYAEVVGRSAALAPGAPYAKTFAYNESDLCSGMMAAVLGTATVGFIGAALMFPPTRYLLTSTLLPKPGQGGGKCMGLCMGLYACITHSC
jgi:hypothetical protein